MIDPKEEDYPKTLIEMEDRFNTEAACLDYLRQLRWPEGFICARCGATEAWHTARGLYHCRRCDSETSVTAGTILHRTRKPLRLWIGAMWHITNQKCGANALGLQRVLSLGSYPTAWQLAAQTASRHGAAAPGPAERIGRSG